ncbi:hypothetical protein GR7B_00180 [Vibrio phage vB_VcorM_GR7B]|nr:hypothetical protein GR7B_00180 [Vibrio phage vB_VcorM_GR7B]
MDKDVRTIMTDNNKLYIYLAGLHETRMHMQMHQSFIRNLIKDTFETDGFQPEVVFTCEDWINNPTYQVVDERASTDYYGVKNCDIFISFSPHGLGTSSEMGYAMGLSKPAIHLMPEEYYDKGNTDLLPLGRYKHVTNNDDVFFAITHHESRILTTDVEWFSYALSRLARGKFL